MAFFLLISITPLISVTIRRLHDIGKSGIYILIIFIPVFGPLYLLFLLSLDSQFQTNIYGPSPKYININEDYLLNQLYYIPPQNDLVVCENIIYNNQGNNCNINNSEISQVYLQSNDNLN